MMTRKVYVNEGDILEVRIVPEDRFNNATEWKELPNSLQLYHVMAIRGYSINFLSDPQVVIKRAGKVLEPIVENTPD